MVNISFQSVFFRYNIIFCWKTSFVADSVTQLTGTHTWGRVNYPVLKGIVRKCLVERKALRKLVIPMRISRLRSVLDRRELERGYDLEAR